MGERTLHLIAALAIMVFAAAPSVRADEARPPAFGREVPSLSTSHLSIRYHASVNGGPVTQVEAFVTQDEGRTWRSFASLRPTDGLVISALARAVGSLTFTAESDGLYGFFIVLHNAAGASSPSPASGTAPQQWIRVDREAPIVQILEVRPDENFDLNRDITIRWTAQDSDLPDRPISLHYRSEKTKSYRLIADLLAATSSFRWTAPEDLVAPFSIKATAIDRAGNAGRSIVNDVKFREGPPPLRAQDRPATASPSQPPPRVDASHNKRPSAVNSFPDAAAFVAPGEPDSAAPTVDRKVNQEAQRKYDSGTWHRLRGETDLAIARFREALDLDPHLNAARHDLAASLLVAGHVEESEKELRSLLTDNPTHRGAIRTLALVQTRRQNYRSAADTLQRLLLLDANDAEAWLCFGDVALFMGDRSGAREAWAKVEGLDGVTEDVRRRAAERLKLYPSRAESGLASGDPEP
jgi:tetratricopeptide repeat protein